MNIYKLSSITSVCFLILQMSPFITWITGPPLLTIPSYCLVIICFLMLLAKGRLIITAKRIILSLLTLLLAAHITLPIFTSILDLGRFIPFCILALILLFPSNILVTSFYYFRKFHLFIALFSIIIFFLGVVVDIPHYTISGVTNIMTGTEYYYKVYGFIVSSTNTIYNIGGLNIARICGIYQEPGHFATYLGILIFIEKLVFNRVSKLFIIAGVLTFSPIFYIALTLIFLYNMIIKKSLKEMRLYLIGIVGLIIIFTTVSKSFTDQIWQLAIGRNISGGDMLERLNERTNIHTLMRYNRFIETPEVWYGRGADYVDKYGIFSDFRGYVFKYGIIGLVLSVLLFLKIIMHSKAFSYLFLMLPFGLLIYLQRSWMLSSVYIYMLLFISYLFYEKYKCSDIKKEEIV